MKTLGTGVGILNLNFQIGSLSEVSFIFNDSDGAPVDLSSWTFEFFVKANKGSRVKDISKTLGNGITMPIYTSNQIDLSFTETIAEGEYVWELRRTDLNKPLLAGLAFFNYDPKQGNTNVTSTIISETVEVEVTISGNVSHNYFQGYWNTTNVLPSGSQFDYWIVPSGGWSYTPPGGDLQFYPKWTIIEQMETTVSTIEDFKRY